MASLRPGVRFAAFAAAVVLALSAGERPAGNAPAPQQPRQLLSVAQGSGAAPRSTAPLDPWERRTRLVSVNTGAIPAQTSATAAAADATEALTIDLFDGERITAVFERSDPNDSGYTWVGHVADRPGSLVTVVHGGGVMAASIVMPDAAYTIRPVPRESDTAAPVSTLHLLTEVDSRGLPAEAPPIVPEMPAEIAADAVEVAMDDSAEFIDVLILYTALAESWAGGPAGILNWINVGISETNSAYATSGVHQRVRLVHAEKVGYAEVGNFSTNLNNLRAGAPGLQTVAGLRNAYTADLVSLFVRPASGATACGIAFLMTTVTPAFAPNGFSVVDAPCSSPGGTLAHEFGHNMGLRHDWYMDRGVTPFSYAHGHVNVNARFRTIMAYPDSCGSLGIVCTRLLRFSNPDMTHLGEPMGVPGGTNADCPTGNAANMSCDADERRALNETALAVANFREFSPLRPPLIRTHPQNQSAVRGQPITLRVEAEGLGPFTYQWFRGSAPSTAQPLPGGTGPEHTLIPGADGVWFERWFYWVQITNSIGSVNSLTATVTTVAPGAAGDAPLRRPVTRDPAGQTTGVFGSAGTARPRPHSGASSGTTSLAAGTPRRSLAAPISPGSEESPLMDGCRALALQAEAAIALLSEPRGNPIIDAVLLARLVATIDRMDGEICRLPDRGGPGG